MLCGANNREKEEPFVNMNVRVSKAEWKQFAQEKHSKTNCVANNGEFRGSPRLMVSLVNAKSSYEHWPLLLDAPAFVAQQ